MPEPNVQKPTTEKKNWDDMTEAEKKAERARLAKLEREAEAADPNFDKSVDKAVQTMKRMFRNEKWFSVTLFQINRSMAAEGMQKLADRECGINGYNFIVPRGVPVKLPESLVRVLYNAGEITGYQMVEWGLLTPEAVAHDEALSEAEAKRLAELGGIQES